MNYKPVLKGHCIHCNKEIYTFDNPEYDWLDHAAFIEMVDNDSCRIFGGYGSTTMDMSTAEFVDYSLYKKCMEKFRKMAEYPELYICDDCIKKLLEEGRIAFSSEFRISPVSMLTKEEHPNGYVQSGNICPTLRRKDIYVPVHKDVFAFKYNEGPERIVEEMRKFEPFIQGDFSIEYYPNDEIVFIFQKGYIHTLVRKDEVLVVYDRDDWSVISEKTFNRRYRYCI